MCARVNQRKQPYRADALDNRRATLESLLGLRQQFSNRGHKGPESANGAAIIDSTSARSVLLRTMRKVDGVNYIYIAVYTPKIIIERLRYFYKTIPDASTLLTQVCAIDVALTCEHGARLHATTPTHEVASRA